MAPYWQDIFMTQSAEHRVNAVSSTHLVIMSSDSVLKEGVDVNIRHVNLGLVVVDVVYMGFVIYYPVLVNFNDHLAGWPIFPAIINQLCSPLLDEFTARFTDVTTLLLLFTK
jgi:hypothetical protein